MQQQQHQTESTIVVEAEEVVGVASTVNVGDDQGITKNNDTSGNQESVHSNYNHDATTVTLSFLQENRTCLDEDNDDERDDGEVRNLFF